METVILDSIKDSTFLVTGGAGFIGSNLCEFLVFNKAKKVICLDNLFNGKLENIKDLMSESNFTFIKGDIRDFDLILILTKDIDYVLHQAAWGSVPRSMVQPLDYTANNVQGTHNVFEASRINNVKKVVYASSSSVYGDHPSLPKKEGIEGNLLSPYALSKRINEEYGKLYWDVFKLPTVGLRYFNVFGRRQNPEGDYAAIIPKFIKISLNGKSPTIYGDGNQSRDFTYIDNVIQANLKAALNSNNNSYGRSYNIAFGEAVKINDLFHMIRNKLDSNIKVNYSKVREGDILYSLADITQARISFSYKPTVNFTEGLDLSISWYKSFFTL